MTSPADHENPMFRDLSRWFTTVIIPVILLSILGWSTYQAQQVTQLRVDGSAMAVQIKSGQEQRATDNTDLKDSISDLKTGIAELKGAIDGLRTSTDGDKQAIAILMEEHNRLQQQSQSK